MLPRQLLRSDICSRDPNQAPIKTETQPLPIPTLAIAFILTQTCTYTLNYSGSKCRESNIRVIRKEIVE